MIYALTINEMDQVFGGNTPAPAPTCPEGTTLERVTYTSTGQVTWTCVPTTTTQTVQEGASLLNTIADAAKKLAEAIGSIF